MQRSTQANAKSPKPELKRLADVRDLDDYPYWKHFHTFVFELLAFEDPADIEDIRKVFISYYTQHPAEYTAAP